MSATEYDKMINQLRRDGGISPDALILPTPLGPIKISDLPFLQGWRYDFFSIGYPGTEIPLVNGGPATVLVDYTDQLGWVLFFLSIFRSPYGTLNFSVDNFNFNASPWLTQLTGLNVNNNVLIKTQVYNPATPLGPLYGLNLTPVYAMPYQSRLQISLNLPAGSPVAATTIFAAAVGKIYIVDYPTFMRSVKRFVAEQMVGARLDRYV